MLVRSPSISRVTGFSPARGLTLLGLLLGHQASAATLTVADLAEGDLIITEVMPDPSATADYQGEWFEIYNNSGSDVDLNGMVLSDDGGESHTVSSSVVVAVGDFAIFAVKSSSALNGGLPSVDYAWKRTEMHFDNGDELNLSYGGVTFDAVQWGSGASLPVTTGATISLDPAYYDAVLNDSPTYWCDGSTAYGLGDLGTPGSDNDDCGISVLTPDDLSRGDLVITEVMVDPTKVSDYYGEWFEIYNNSGNDVNLRTLALEDDGTDHHVVSSDLIVAAGGYALLASKALTTVNGGLPTVDYAFTRAQFAMDNGSDEINLVNGTGTTLDEFAWNKTAPKSTAGYAISLDPSSTDADLNDSASAWCDASSTYGSGDHGTPDEANDACTTDGDGDGYSADLDCDDADATVYPGADELCDGIDNDCDSAIDEDATDATVWYIDHDEDGFGSDFYTVTECDNPLPTVFVADNTDCDDLDDLSYPGAAEICDGADNDCDTVVDNGVTDGSTFYADADSDGWGDAATTETACDASTGFVSNDNDCDDTDATVSPDGAEVCDDVDNDCDGEIDDDASDALEWYLDYDDDGYGADKITAWSCDMPTYYVDNVDDCDDLDSATSPDATEVCGDFFDNNCDDSALDCSVTGNVDLSVADAKLTGNTTYTDSGRGIAIIGDINGDGYDDMAVGAPSTSIKDGSTTGTLNAGIVYVVHGPLTGVSALATEADGTLEGEVAGDQAGYSVESADDFDGDGYADLIIGARDEATGGTGAGAVYVVNGPVSAGTSLSTATYKWTGQAAAEVAGFVVGGTGDVDGDGEDDFSTGAYGYSSDTGAVYIIAGAGAASGSLSDATAILVGEVAGDRAGRWSASHSDVNADGYADVLTGAYLADPSSKADAGRAYLNYGPVTGTLSLTDADAIYDGEVAGNQAGYVVDNSGDVNGDGYADLLISAIYEASIGSRNGAAYLIYGPAGTSFGLASADAKFTGVVKSDHAGTRLGIVEDMNGDDRAEIAIGAFGEDAGGSEAGATYLVYGTPSGSMSLSSADAKFIGEATKDRQGNGLGSGGDIDGDGYNDLLLGSLREATGGAYSGATYLVLGSGW